jgi:hypothetical protein
METGGEIISLKDCEGFLEEQRREQDLIDSRWEDNKIRAAMKFKNGTVSLDEAVQSIIDSGEEFTVPNGDLLIKAALDTDWSEK